MKRTSVIASILITILLVLGSVGLFSHLKPNQQNNTSNTNSTPPTNWRKYTDPYTGFSIYYPARDGVSGEDPLKPIYPKTGYPKNSLFFIHENGWNSLSLIPFSNSTNLPLAEIIKHKNALQFSMLDTYEVWLEKDKSAYISYKEIAGREALLVTQSQDTRGLVGFCQYGVFIPHQNTIVAAYLCPSNRTIDLGFEASSAAEARFFEILNTLEFFNPTTTEERGW